MFIEIVFNFYVLAFVKIIPSYINLSNESDLNYKLAIVEFFI